MAIRRRCFATTKLYELGELRVRPAGAAGQDLKCIPADPAYKPNRCANIKPGRFMTGKCASSPNRKSNATHSETVAARAVAVQKIVYRASMIDAGQISSAHLIRRRQLWFQIRECRSIATGGDTTEVAADSADVGRRRVPAEVS